MTNKEAAEALTRLRICNSRGSKTYLKEVLTRAINALMAVPCEDCISRQAVNNLVDELARAISDERCCIPRGRSTATIMQDIIELPSVQPKQKWIPVSERLPKSSGVYIVTREFNDGIERKMITDACYFDGTSTWHNDNRINHDREYVDKKIKAWMPLPEPYKVESEE